MYVILQTSALYERRNRVRQSLPKFLSSRAVHPDPQTTLPWFFSSSPVPYPIFEKFYPEAVADRLSRHPSVAACLRCAAVTDLGEALYPLGEGPVAPPAGPCGTANLDAMRPPLYLALGTSWVVFASGCVGRGGETMVACAALAI